MTDTRILLVTVPDHDTGSAIVRRLVEEGLVACGNLVPGLLSIYRWEGQVQEDPELLVVLKTHRDRIDELLVRIPELHPYDVPEVLALPVSEGFEPYVDWVARECGAAASSGGS